MMTFTLDMARRWLIIRQKRWKSNALTSDSKSQACDVSIRDGRYVKIKEGTGKNKRRREARKKEEKLSSFRMASVSEGRRIEGKEENDTSTSKTTTSCHFLFHPSGLVETVTDKSLLVQGTNPLLRTASPPGRHAFKSRDIARLFRALLLLFFFSFFLVSVLC